ncbi:NfeD family protein [Aquabacterium sp.]|uniref:NfeD family protein n=1 Tax=Aquabacterium sp. TaxID=1872578 RepID=UPI0035AF85D9
MTDSTMWWIAAGVLTGLELASGTFYLLMLALGLAAAALSASLGASHATQLVMAAVVGGGAVVLWHVVRTSRPTPASRANPDVNLDIGNTVHVSHWHADGTARVQHRGAPWDARYEGGTPPTGPGDYVIRAIDGATLVLGR